ncbi:MAG: ABC transporter substrate-binding protein [Frankia sp.]
MASAVAALAATTLLAACGSSSGSASTATASNGRIDLSKVTVRVADQVSGTRSRLEASGALKGVPYKIEWSQFAAASPQLQAVRANAADLAFAGDAPTLNAIGAGAGIKIVQAVRGESAANLALLVPKNSPIKTVADLKGKTVSPTTKGSIGHYLLLGALKQAGVNPKDVTISFLAPSAASAAFTSGSIDAWATWDPFVALAEAKGARVLLTGQNISKGLGFVDASSKALNDPAKKAAIADFLSRNAQSFAWEQKNPTGFAQLYSTLTKLPLSVATVVAQRGVYQQVPINQTVIADLQEEADVYTAAGVIPKKLDVATAFVPSLTTG